MMKICILLLFLTIFTDLRKGEDTMKADVADVNVSGFEGNYTFYVTIKSPDTGCDQYSDWWEVIGPAGELIYRRILTHSHVDEQPFTRSGGKVHIMADQEVIIRAHMNNTGYGGIAMSGSVKDGFKQTDLEKDFAFLLEKEEPLPDGCAF
jgi:hypothetical protein